MLKAILTILSNKPGIGAGISGSSFITGLYLKMGLQTGLHEIINNCLQSAAFVITIVIGILTIVSWLRKNRQNKH